MRATCFPRFYEDHKPSKIPITASGSEMINVDMHNHVVRWNETIANDKKILNKAWHLFIGEDSDEADETKRSIGYSAQALFKSKKVSNKLINLKADQDSRFVLAPID